MEVAVVGAGIVGACTAWALARQGAEVTLYERKQPMGETSRASSKLLHGGLRYLETGQFRLVGKALHARTDWLELAPHLCHRLELLLPMYRDKGRSQFTISAGIRIYDVLAMGSGFPRARVLKPSEVLALQPGLSPEGLVGAWAFFDAQMDDYALGNWVIEQAVMSARAKIAEGKNMAEPLAETQVFPSMVVQMIAVGEQTGALDTMLNKIADFYEEEVDVAVAALTSMLEPLMMVFIGGSCGTMLIAMYLPIFDIAGKIKTN